MLPLLGCAAIGHGQGKPATGTERNKLSGHPCCINEGDGRTWQPKHVNHRPLEGLQRLDWLISWRKANPIWQDMAPTLRKRERLTSPRTLRCSSTCVRVRGARVFWKEARHVFSCAWECESVCVFACDNSTALVSAPRETSNAEWLVWKLKCQMDYKKGFKRMACSY